MGMETNSRVASAPIPEFFGGLYVLRRVSQEWSCPRHRQCGL